MPKFLTHFSDVRVFSQLIKIVGTSMALAALNENHIPDNSNTRPQTVLETSLPPHSQWAPGDIVRLHSLRKQAEWNGLYGQIIDAQLDDMHRLHIRVYLACLRRHSVRIPVSNLEHIGQEPSIDVVWIHATNYNKRACNSLFTIVRNARNQCVSPQASHTTPTMPQGNLMPFVQSQVKISQLLDHIDQIGYVRHRTPVSTALDHDLLCFAAPAQSTVSQISINPSSFISAPQSSPSSSLSSFSPSSNSSHSNLVTPSLPRLSMRLRFTPNPSALLASNQNVAATALTASIKSGVCPHQIVGSAVLIRCANPSNSNKDHLFARNLDLNHVFSTLSFIHTLRTARTASPDGFLPRSIRAALPAAYQAFLTDIEHEQHYSFLSNRISRTHKPIPRLPQRRPLPRRSRTVSPVSVLPLLQRSNPTSSDAAVPTHVC